MLYYRYCYQLVLPSNSDTFFSGISRLVGNVFRRSNGLKVVEAQLLLLVVHREDFGLSMGLIFKWLSKCSYTSHIAYIEASPCALRSMSRSFCFFFMAGKPSHVLYSWLMLDYWCHIDILSKYSGNQTINKSCCSVFIDE